MIDTGSIWKPKYPLCNDEKYAPKHRWSLKTILLSLVKANLKDESFRKQVNISRIEYALKKVLPSYMKAVQNKTGSLNNNSATSSDNYYKHHKYKYKHVYVNDDNNDETTKFQNLIVARLKDREMYYRNHRNSKYYKFFGKYLNKAIINAEFKPNQEGGGGDNLNNDSNMSRPMFLRNYIEPVVENTTKANKKILELEEKVNSKKNDLNITKGIIRVDKRLIDRYVNVKIPRQKQMYKNMLKINKERQQKVDFENHLE